MSSVTPAALSDCGNAAFGNILFPELLSQLAAERSRDITQQSGEAPPACEERKSPRVVFHSLPALLCQALGGDSRSGIPLETPLHSTELPIPALHERLL